MEVLSTENLTYLIELVLELWTDCNFEEEFEHYKTILGSKDEICYLVRDGEIYIAFIHLTIRTHYVQGADESPVAYLEAVFVKPNYQKEGVAKKLVLCGEEWSRRKGCSQIASDAELNNYGSIDFHKKAGFRETNRIVCFIKEL